MPGNINPGFENLCRLEADLSKMGAAVERKHGPDGPYDYLAFTIAIEFGGTELRARIQWNENVGYMWLIGFYFWQVLI